MKNWSDQFDQFVFKICMITFILLCLCIYTCSAQDSTTLSNKKLIGIAIEIQDLRLADSLNNEIILEQDLQILHMQIKGIQDSLTIDKLQSIANTNIAPAIVPGQKRKWYQGTEFNFALGALTGAASIYIAAIVINKLK